MLAATIIIGAAFFVFLYLRPVSNYSFDVSSANPDIGRMEEDGNDIVPELFETDFGTVGLKIPVGYYNGVHISYHENILYRISEFISVLTLAGLAVFRTRKHGRKEDNQ